MPAPQPSDDGRFRLPGRGARPPQLPPRRWLTALFCLLTVAWVLAFSPRPLALATVPGVVGWLAVVERSRSFREAIFWLLCFGALATAIGYRWLAPTVQDFGGVDPVASWVLVALFGVAGTIHGWVFAAFYRGMLKRGRRPHPLITAALIAACETLPIRLFAWSGGHGAVDVAPLRQAAEWGGVPAVSFALYCLVVPIYEWLRWAFVRGGAPARARAAAVTFAVGLALFAAGALRYQQVRAEDADATERLRVAIVQPDVGSHRKRDATNDGGKLRLDGIAAYRSTTEKALAEDPEVVVWPETAITDAVPMRDALQTNRYLHRVGYDFVNEFGRDRAFIIGLYEKVLGRRDIVSGRPLENRYNVAAIRQPGDVYAEWTNYRKVHLIPFGETMPLGIFEDRLPQNFRMEAGALPQPLLELEHRGITFAPFVCYEGILADHVREYVAGTRPDILLSLTNDSWFGGSWEPYQHLNFTRFRAVEHRAPLVRATNTGISAFVDATGEVVASLDVGAKDAIVRSVPLVACEPTLYVRLGHHLPLLLWVVALAGWLVAMLRPPPVVR